MYVISSVRNRNFVFSQKFRLRKIPGLFYSHMSHILEVYEIGIL